MNARKQQGNEDQPNRDSGALTQCPQCGGLGYVTQKIRRRESKNRELNAHIRDIARHRYGEMTVPERIFKQVLDDFKKSEVWPKYDNPEPDYFTGETLYRPLSRSDLTDQQILGIVNWLEHFMHSHEIESHRPVENWQT